MKPNYYFITFTVAMLIVTLLNFLVELNAYTPPVSESDQAVMGQVQDAFKVVDYPMTLITLEEQCINEESYQVPCHALQDVQKGDILISKSSHTLLFRHGHAGIVVDAEAGLVLESLGYGETSTLQPLSKWDYYPTVIVLRLKDATPELMDQIVEIAQTQFLNLDYNVFVSKKDLSATHCSDIVWKIFNEVGIDLDSNGGRTVTPQDIAASELLYEVESYGFSSEREW